MHATTQNNQPPTTESRNAAFLLLKLKSLAENELKGAAKEKRTVARFIPHESFALPEETSDSDEESVDISVSPLRSRTVSVCSQDIPGQSSPHRCSPVVAQDSVALYSPSPPDSPNQESSSIVGGLDDLFTKPPSTKLVGTEARSPLKGVLKRKFAWKQYPELEHYLVANRGKYLQYSSQLNYTAEQKRYNNKLTQGLLDLANEEGYAFEGFTFAAIRDRIRCYYKSFVQAVKKKKRKKRAN